MDVVSLLESKNRILRKFLESSKRFLASAENGDFSTLAAFHRWRDYALKSLDRLDARIMEAVGALSPSDRNETLSRQVENCLQLKESLVRSILESDARVIALIENEKRRISQEIGQTEKSKSTVSKYKSKWVPEAGEELDKTL